MRRTQPFFAYLPDVLLVLLEGWLIVNAFHVYQSLREFGPGVPVPAQGKFGWGTVSLESAFVVNVLVATTLAAALVGHWWVSRPVVLDAEVRPRGLRPPEGSARKLRKRKHRR